MLGLLRECHKQMRQCGNVFRLTCVSERLVAQDDLILIDFKTLTFNRFSPSTAFLRGGDKNSAAPRQTNGILRYEPAAGAFVH